MYGIPQDKIALQQWQEVLPGYEIKGFDFEFAKEPESLQIEPGIQELAGVQRCSTLPDKSGMGRKYALYCCQKIGGGRTC